jgi:signal transduction histidine kinase
VQLPTAWPGRRLHVVETRGGPTRSLEWLHAFELMRKTTKSDKEIADELQMDPKEVQALRERMIRKYAAGNGQPPMERARIASELHVDEKRLRAVLGS